MKNYTIKLLPIAENDLSEIIAYLSDFSDNTALNQYDRIIAKINGLKQFPFIYKEFEIKSPKFKYRQMIVDNYMVFYVVYEDFVEIHRIIHMKQNLSKFFDEV